jgi:hypothetical protein
MEISKVTPEVWQRKIGPFTGRESAENRVLNAITYPGQKIVPPSLCKKIYLLRNATIYTRDW